MRYPVLIVILPSSPCKNVPVLLFVTSWLHYPVCIILFESSSQCHLVSFDLFLRDIIITKCRCVNSLSLRARAHWPLCLATGSRVFRGGPEHTRATCGGDSKVSYPPAKFPYSAKFPTLLNGCHMPHKQSLVCSLPNAERSHKNALSVAGTSHRMSNT